MRYYILKGWKGMQGYKSNWTYKIQNEGLGAMKLTDTFEKWLCKCKWKLLKFYKYFNFFYTRGGTKVLSLTYLE